MSLEVWSSVLTFVGSAILVIDALLAPRRALLRKIADHLDSKTQRPEGEPSAGSQFEERVARSTRWLAVLGFAVLTIGFLLDLIVKCKCLNG